MADHVDEVARVVASIIPDNEFRTRYLELFLEALLEANRHGRNKWGAYCENGRVRLLVGKLIVFTIHRNGVWITLDKPLLDKCLIDQRALADCADWRWDTGRYAEYRVVPSKNGYYTPSESHAKIWPTIRELHFTYLDNVARKFAQLNSRSQAKHTPALLCYLHQTLNQPVPEPFYETARADFALPEEILGEESFLEGGKRQITVNAYERNPKARQECIAHHGTTCVVCGFNFADVYGLVGEGFIHVHHLKQLAEIGAQYEVNPVSDLHPVCPNCHAIIHRRNPPYLLEEVRVFLKKQ